MSFKAKIAPALDALGMLDAAAVLSSGFAGRELTILNYHRIAVPGAQPFQSDRLISATPDEFDEQMRWLARHRTPIGFTDLKSGELPRRAVIVTFDDGYLDNYLHAYPVLQRYGIRATIFLVTGAVGTSTPFWWDAVAVAIGSKGLAAEYERIKQLSDEERTREVDRIVRGAGLNPDRFPRSVVNWDEVLEMSEAGIEFGGHTVNHPVLTKISDDRLEEEIEGCKRAIEERTERPVLTFAYPVGRAFAVSDSVVEVVRAAGYSYAVTTSYGRCDPFREDRFRLRRVGVGLEDSMARFKAKILAPRFFGPLVKPIY